MRVSILQPHDFRADSHHLASRQHCCFSVSDGSHLRSGVSISSFCNQALLLFEGVYLAVTLKSRLSISTSCIQAVLLFWVFRWQSLEVLGLNLIILQSGIGVIRGCIPGCHLGVYTVKLFILHPGSAVVLGVQMQSLEVLGLNLIFLQPGISVIRRCIPGCCCEV